MQHKRTKQSPGPNRVEGAFLAWCKQQPSIVSGVFGVEVHHCVGSSRKVYVGAQRVHIGHWFCIPLTTEEHWLYHNRKNEFYDLYGDQCDLWLNLIAEYGIDIPEEVIEGIKQCGT